MLPTMYNTMNVHIAVVERQRKLADCTLPVAVMCTLCPLPVAVSCTPLQCGINAMLRCQIHMHRGHAVSFNSAQAMLSSSIG